MLELEELDVEDVLITTDVGDKTELEMPDEALVGKKLELEEAPLAGMVGEVRGLVRLDVETLLASAALDCVITVATEDETVVTTTTVPLVEEKVYTVGTVDVYTEVGELLGGAV